MKKRKTADPLIAEIERALDLGQFISYSQAWGFIQDLGDTKERIDSLVELGEAERAVGLYKIFLSGCYEKADEIDDSDGDLGMFFEELFCAWIKARQKAGCKADETVQYILKWMENDDYGFCYDIERHVAQVLDNAGFSLFKAHFEDQFDNTFTPFKSKAPMFNYDYPRDVSYNAEILKAIYTARKDVKSYQALCEKIAMSPKDCEEIAKLQMAKRQYTAALSIVEKGLKLEKARDWRNESGYSLTRIKEELLSKMGRKDEAFDMAWLAFEASPSVYAYDNLMKYVVPKDRKKWHEKALLIAYKSNLSDFIVLCVKTKEWDLLAERILIVKHEELESISHYTIEPAAKGLYKKSGLAAAKVYRALGIRILNSKKSKYYCYALQHFKNAKDLYIKSGKDDMWQAVVKEVRERHSRKYSFIGDFEKIVEGHTIEFLKSFEERVRKRWTKQTL